MKLLKGSFPQVVAGGLVGLHGGRESAPQRFKHSITIIPNSILPPQYIESNHSYTMLNLILMLFSICTSEISQIQLCCFYEVGFVGSSKTDLAIKHLCPRSWMISVISCAICWQSGAVFDDDKDVCLNAAEDYSVHSFQIKLFKLRWKGFWGKHTLPLGANNLWDLFFQFQ